MLTLVHRSSRRGDPASPYFVNSGYVFAPATSANDSEISSDATTDDSRSMTDSSVYVPSKLYQSKPVGAGGWYRKVPEA